VGQGGVLQTLFGSAGQERAHVVDEVVSAAESLAGRRIGALLVLERSTGLRHYAELGVQLDALVSADLLISVFLPYSPLHDGAVFVRGDRVVAAGCFLPLSRNIQVGRALGTRHRAALGVSEETDAVGVVVSEETGRISLAVEGQIEPFNDVEGLRRRLRDLAGATPAPSARESFWRGVRRMLPRPGDQL
jgi:diadenylate cyclase